MTKNERAAAQVVKRYRREVDALEYEVLFDLARQFNRMTDRIRKQAARLFDASVPVPRGTGTYNGTYIPPRLHYEMTIRPEITRTLEACTKGADRAMSRLSKQTARLGIRAADESALRLVPDQKRTWEKIKTAGLFAGSSKLLSASKDALKRLPGAVMDKLDTLVNTALQMAENGAEWLSSQIGNLLGSMWSGIRRTVQTLAEQLFRRGQQEQRQQTPIQQWRRVANYKTACLACLLLDGHIYDKAEDFADHPNGRCCIVPVEPGSEPEKTGRQWLEEQDEETQRRIMGKGRFEAWQNGDLSLDQMTEVRPDPVNGPQPRIIPLKELGLR